MWKRKRRAVTPAYTFKPSGIPEDMDWENPPDDAIDNYNPDDAIAAHYAAREREGDDVAAAAIAVIEAQSDKKTVQFTVRGQRYWAIRTGGDEFAVRADFEYDPTEFGD